MMKYKRSRLSVGLLILALVTATLYIYLSQHFYLAYSIDNSPSPRTITIVTTNPSLSTINPTPSEVRFDLKVSVDFGTFSANGSENICLMVFGEQATERSATIATELWSHEMITIDNRILLPGMPSKGRFGGLYATLYTCFNVSNLSQGLHVISLSASTETGIAYSQSWQIRIR